MSDRAGTYRSNLSGELGYRSFVPSALPPIPPITLDDETVQLLATANRRIGILDAMSSQLADMEMFAAMYVRKEALLSSQIEGTQATLDDILDPKAAESANRNVADVINYIRASQFAAERLRDLPICSRLLAETHAILMQDVRGGEKSPGEFRHSQNWIGPAGSTIKDVCFVPPNPEDMTRAMSDLEKFIHAADPMDPLVKIALIHYQFETIHPFLDGNGRIGRLLISLFLIEKNLLRHEILYVSYFFKRNRIEYYDRLNEVRDRGNYEQWIRFFLQAISESAQDAVQTIESLSRLHDQNLQSIAGKGKSAHILLQVFQYLEKNPIIGIVKTSEELGRSFNAVAHAAERLIGLGILRQTSSAQRYRVFAYEDYLRILRKDT